MIFKRPTNKYGDTANAEIPYHKGQRVWDHRIGSARTQARNWRFIAFGCLSLLGLLSIAFHMASFIKHVRSVSIDPVALRGQWETAYDFVTESAAQILNEYTRENDPFKEIACRSVAVEITSVVRASDDSFQVKWMERHYMNGAFQKLERHTAILTIFFQKPSTAARLEKNPLGIYIHGLNWSLDLDQGEKQ